MMVGIAQRESGYGTSIETQILHDNTTHRTEAGANVIAAARSLIAAGHSVDLGPWQINSRNLSLLGMSLQDAFDPCQSVAGAARLLQSVQRLQHRFAVARDCQRICGWRGRCNPAGQGRTGYRRTADRRTRAADAAGPTVLVPPQGVTPAVSLLTFAQNVAQFIVGPFGISMITFCIGACALAAAMHAMRWSNVFTAVFMGAILFSSSWIVTTFLGG